MDESGRVTRASTAARQKELDRLNGVYHTAKEDLDALLSTDLAQIAESSESLESLAIKLKAAFKQYDKDSRSLSLFLVHNEKVLDAQEIRDTRSGHSKDTKETIFSINAMLSGLGCDRVSNFETSSNFSGFSQTNPGQNVNNNCLVPPTETANVSGGGDNCLSIPSNVVSNIYVSSGMSSESSRVERNVTLGVRETVPLSVRPKYHSTSMPYDQTMPTMSNNVTKPSLAPFPGGQLWKGCDSNLYTKEWLQMSSGQYPIDNSKSNVNVSSVGESLFPPFGSRNYGEQAQSRAYRENAYGAPGDSKTFKGAIMEEPLHQIRENPYLDYHSRQNPSDPNASLFYSVGPHATA